MTGLFSERCGDLLTGSYDCVDRIVLDAYFSLGHSPGGFRVWWRRWHGDGDQRLDNVHLMRLAGRFARRVRASAQAHGIPVIDCKAGDRKDQIAEDYLAEHPPRTGVFLILVARAPATVWKVSRSGAGVICNLEKRKEFVNHYSFHIMDPTWGHVTIKISGRPPFGAQLILNGHEYVACAARAAGIGFTKEGNCFTRVSEPERLAQIADTFSQPGTTGRLSRVIDRWIYTACLCFGLNIDEQERSGFVYDYSIYQRQGVSVQPRRFSICSGPRDCARTGRDLARRRQGTRGRGWGPVLDQWQHHHHLRVRRLGRQKLAIAAQPPYLLDGDPGGLRAWRRSFQFGCTNVGNRGLRAFKKAGGRRGAPSAVLNAHAPRSREEEDSFAGAERGNTSRSEMGLHRRWRGVVPTTPLAGDARSGGPPPRTAYQTLLAIVGCR